MAQNTAGEGLLESIRQGYSFEDATVTLGAAVVGDEVHADTPVRLPLRMMNRHGLVAGATGTGKTKTLQMMAEQLSSAGVPVFLADVKGDLSGLAVAGEASEKLAERTTATGMALAVSRPTPWSSSPWAATAWACPCAPPWTRSGPCCSPGSWSSTRPRSPRCS